MSRILVIADSHINPVGAFPVLWRCLGEYCVKTKPDYVVHLGDVADLDSQAWLKASRGMYELDQEIDVVRCHLGAFHNAIKQHNENCRQMHRAMYNPKLVLCLGNHDVRNGSTAIADLFTEFGWEVHDYLDMVQIDNVTFTHCARKGLSDTMCVTAQELLENWHGNIIVGHGHHKDFAEGYSLATGEAITALRCPVFNKNEPAWAAQTNKKWSRGFTEITTNPFRFIWRDLSCLCED